jgi:hypothetical protein
MAEGDELVEDALGRSSKGQWLVFFSYHSLFVNHLEGQVADDEVVSEKQSDWKRLRLRELRE